MPDVQHSTLTGAELHEPKGITGAMDQDTYVADGAGSGSWTRPEPKGSDTASAGEVYVADGAGSGNWRPRSYVIQGLFADLGTNEIVLVPVPLAGTVVRVTGVLEGAITVSDETVTVKDSGGNSMGAITIAQPGSAKGDIDTLTPASNNTVTDNDWIELETLGNSTGPQRWWFSVVVERSS